MWNALFCNIAERGLITVKHHKGAILKFSQRMGITSAEKIIQIESIDVDLRNSLWSVLSEIYWKRFNLPKYHMGDRCDRVSNSNLGSLFTSLWLHYFKLPIDTIPIFFYDEKNALNRIRENFFSAKWFEIYDFIEFVAVHGPKAMNGAFIATCNDFLERENSGYRFVCGKIVEISSSDEISEIDNAISKSTPYYGVKQHLSSAISLLSDRKNPDYRNSIKESISAVESLCKSISGKDNATLGAALKELEKNNLLHPALKSAFSSLYGYTNDTGGIRHALMEESTLTGADARFMLISCSAFVNYVIASTNSA